MLYKKIVRPILFSLDPEFAHHVSFTTLKVLHRVPLALSFLSGHDQHLKHHTSKNILGLSFPNTIGLAAGFDKNGECVDALSKLGFGFIEIGTVTPRPQSGNPRPRLFRLPQDHAIINRMGFNNHGADVIAERLRQRKSKVIVGGNIGKNKDTPNERAVDDYLYCFKALADTVDYFVVNVSSPNTPNLRELQEKGALLKILESLQQENRNLSKPKPILLKIAPDLSNSQLDDVVEIVLHTQIDGVIATNTTISREGLKTGQEQVADMGMGGLSGMPVQKRSTQVVQYLAQATKGKMIIIGVGGIFSGEDVREKLKAGADLVQVYTGLIYEGPKMITNLLRALYKS